MEKRISIIIPIYNSEAYLKKCLEAVCFQTYSNLEIILINDGSTDSSAKIINEFSEKDKRIIAIHKENGGIGSAYKCAFELMTGDYVLFVDSDDWLELDAVEKLLQLAEKNNADIVSFGLRAFNANGENVTHTSLKNIDLINNTKEDILKTHFEVLKHPTLARLFKRELFNDIVVFEQNIGIDEMLTPQLLYNCNKIVYTSEIYYNVLVRPESVSRAVYNEKKIMQYIKVNRFTCSFMDKNIPRYAVFSQVKYLENINFIYTESLRNKNLIDKILQKEVLSDIIQFYQKVRNSVNFKSIHRKIRISLFLIVYFPYLFRLYVCFIKK